MKFHHLACLVLLGVASSSAIACVSPALRSAHTGQLQATVGEQSSPDVTGPRPPKQVNDSPR